MRMSEAFASKYLKAADLQGRRVFLQINIVQEENIGRDDKPENKPVMYFMGKEKGLVLNKTNADQLAAMYGDESDAWQGKTIELYTQKVQYQGQAVDGIRVAPPPNQPMASQSLPDGRPVLNTPPVRDPLDDEIVF